MRTPGFTREVSIFAEAMVYKLRRNAHKGRRWEGLSNDELFDLLGREVEELKGAIKEGNRIEIILEAADVANFALMLAWNAMKGAIDHGN